MEVGLLDMETTIKNRISCTNRVAKTNRNILGKITRNTHKGNWKEVTDQISDVGMESEGIEGRTTQPSENKKEKTFLEQLNGLETKRER